LSDASAKACPALQLKEVIQITPARHLFRPEQASAVARETFSPSRPGNFSRGRGNEGTSHGTLWHPRSGHHAGTDNRDIFVALEGDDVVNAGGGDDLINGGQGRDVLNGGDGNDTIHGGTEDDIISGGNGDDTLNGDEGNDTFTGDAGADAMNGGTGTDTVVYSAIRTYYGGYRPDAGQSGVDVNLQTGHGSRLAAGDTYVSVENVVGSNGNDNLVGSSVANVMSGGRGNDTIDGGAGSDTLDGGLGDDTILGGTGRDTLIGGLGRDIMNGGTGADSFIFNADLPGNASTDEISGFEVGVDRIVFRGFEGGTIVTETVDGGTLVWAQDGDERSDSVMLYGVDEAALDASTSLVMEVFEERARIDIEF
jgi:Ca2+-binding RTX toxin-like protein